MSKMWGPYYNHPLMRFLRFFTDIVILNLVFVICCLPIVTIGASLTSMYHVTLKMVRKEYPDIVKDFFQAFRQNFGQATILWGIIVLVGFLIGLDGYFIRFISQEPTTQTILSVLLGILGLILVVGVVYLFAYIARFKNSTLAYVKNSFAIAILNLPVTLLLIICDAIILFLFVQYTAVLMYLSFFIFALVVYLKSHLFTKVFQKYE